MEPTQAASGANSLSSILATGLTPLQVLWYEFVSYLPGFIAAVLILAIGWIVAVLVGRAVAGIFRYAGLDSWIEKRGIKERLRLDIGPNFGRVSDVLGSVVKWLMILATIGLAAGTAGLPEISQFVNVIFAYIPNVIVASVILAVGVLAAQYASEFLIAGVNVARFPIRNREILGSIVKYAIITLTVMAALLQLGIVPELIQILFAGLVLALALAFGLGGRDHASDAIQKMREQA